MSHALEYGQAARGVIIRRTYPELEEVERRASEFYPATGARWNGSKRTWKFPGGATLRLRSLHHDVDADKYQGHSYTFIGIDEVGQFGSPIPIDKLRATLRSATGIPCVWRCTANPGGRAHNWLKARYVDPAPPMTPFYDAEYQTWRVFIPSRLEDNRILTDNDPNYWKRVEAAAGGRKDLLQAWRWGNWDIVAGGLLDDLWQRRIHVVKPFDIPSTWKLDRSFDWGSSRPASVQWWAESDGTAAPNGMVYSRGSLFQFAEWYTWNGKPNEGLRLTSAQIGRRMREMERNFNGAFWQGQRNVLPGPADPSIFSTMDGHSVAADMKAVGISWESANNARVLGWERVRQMLMAAAVWPMEEPGLFVFENCTHTIRTVPVLPRDGNNPDDADSESEDHAGDALRYRAMALKHTVKKKKLSGF